MRLFADTPARLIVRLDFPVPIVFLPDRWKTTLPVTARPIDVEVAPTARTPAVDVSPTPTTPSPPSPMPTTPSPPMPRTPVRPPVPTTPSSGLTPHTPAPSYCGSAGNGASGDQPN